MMEGYQPPHVILYAEMMTINNLAFILQCIIYNILYFNLLFHL